MTSPAPTLWPHQSASIEAVLLSMRAGSTSGLIVLPCGCGKTGTVLGLGRRLKDVPMLFLVNRDELLSQTVRAAERFWPEASVATICAGTSAWDEPDLLTHRRPDLVVSMVPSLVGRLRSIDPERFGIVVADEAHLSAASTWCQVLDHFIPGYYLGVTATAARHDGKPLSRFGSQPLYTYSLYQAIKDGRLVAPHWVKVETHVDLDRIESAEGDLATKELSRTVNTPGRNALIADAWLREAQGRRSIAFCVDKAHCLDVQAALSSRGARCEAILGTMHAHHRRQVLADFAAGRYDVLTNCEVLTTGFDDPGISCLLMARPTESRTLFVQAIGRGLRLAPQKSECLVLEFTDNSTRHKLVCAADLLGRRGSDGDGPKQYSPHKPEEDKPRQAVLANAVARWKLEELCPWPDLPTLEGYESTQPWQDCGCSNGQLSYLSKLGLEITSPLTAGEASYLIDRCREYHEAFPPPATLAQRCVLERAGLWTTGMGRRQASALIGQLRSAPNPQPAGDR